MGSTGFMAMIFAAENLSSNEKNLLLTCANICTQKGTFTADYPRLIRSTGMSKMTVIRTVTKLEGRGILSVIRRNRGLDPLSNAYRINAAELAALIPANPPEYADDVLAELFDAAEAETCSDQPKYQVGTSVETGPDQPKYQVGTSVGDSQGAKYQVGTSGKTGPDQPKYQVGTSKEEEDLNTPPPTPSSTEQRQAIENGRAFIAGMPAAILNKLTAVQRGKLERMAAKALMVGHDPDALRRELISDLEGVRSFYAVIGNRFRDLPAEPLPSPRLRVVRAAEAPAAPSQPHNPARPDVFGEPGIAFVPSRLRGAIPAPAESPVEPSEADSGTDTRTV